MVFAQRARRFQSECGWCGKAVGEDAPVVMVGARLHRGIDDSLVAGKVIELSFPSTQKTVLAAVTGLDSQARAEGKDVVFMTCSDECGHEINRAFEIELAHGLDLHQDDASDDD